MKVLVLFDGKGCVSNIGKKLGHEVRSLDVIPFDHIDYPIDILEFNPEITKDWIPDMIWGSPPCETFSIKTAMKGGGNMYWETIKQNNKVTDIKPRSNFNSDKRLKYPDKINSKRELHTKFVDKMIDIINYYQSKNPNLIWCLENPASGFMRHYLKTITSFNENKTTYCQYGLPYRKETSIFSNFTLNLKWCHTHRKGFVDDCGGHTDSFALRWDKHRQSIDQIIPQTYLERSSIPDKLCVDIINQVEHIFHEIM